MMTTTLKTRGLTLTRDLVGIFTPGDDAFIDALKGISQPTIDRLKTYQETHGLIIFAAGVGSTCHFTVADDKRPLMILNIRRTLFRTKATIDESLIEHELVHVDQWARGDYLPEMIEDTPSVHWKGEILPICDIGTPEYWTSPWEIEAYSGGAERVGTWKGSFYYWLHRGTFPLFYTQKGKVLLAILFNILLLSVIVTGATLVATGWAMWTVCGLTYMMFGYSVQRHHQYLTRRFCERYEIITM